MKKDKKSYFDLKEGDRVLLVGSNGLEEVLDVQHLDKDGFMLAALIGSGDPRMTDFPLHKYIHISNQAGLQNLGSRGYGRRTHIRLEYYGEYEYQIIREK